MSKEKSVIKRLAQCSIKQHHLQNSLSGIVIMLSTFLLSFSAIFIVNAAIGVSSISGFPKEAIVTVIGVVVIIICASRMAVSSILYASAKQRTHEYATLQLVGTTQQQIGQMIRLEEHWMEQRYIPVGAALGLLGNVILPVGYHLFADLAVMFFSGLIICITVKMAFRKPLKIAAGVSPLEATKPTLLLQTPTRHKAKNRRLTPFHLAIGYIVLDRKKSIYTFCSLILSGVLMFAAFSVLQAVNVEKLASFPFAEGSSLYLEHNSDYLTAKNDYSYNELMKNSPFTEQLKAELEAIPGVSKIYQLKSLDIQLINPDTGEMCEAGSIESILDTSAFAGKIVEGEAPAYVPEQDIVPVVINRASLLYQEWELAFNTGDLITALIDNGKETEATTIRVSGFIEDLNAGTIFFTDEHYLNDLSEMNCDLIWYVTTEKGTETTVANAVTELLRQEDRVSINILKNAINSYNALFKNVSLIISAFVILISSFSIINLVNTCITNTLFRQYDYVLLEAIGMTKKQLSRMRFTESLVVIFGSFIGSCVLGIPIGIWLCSRIAHLTGIFYVTYAFPALFLGVYFLASCVIFLLLFAWQQHINNKGSITDWLKLLGR